MKGILDRIAGTIYDAVRLGWEFQRLEPFRDVILRGLLHRVEQNHIITHDGGMHHCTVCYRQPAGHGLWVPERETEAELEDVFLVDGPCCGVWRGYARHR